MAERQKETLKFKRRPEKKKLNRRTIQALPSPPAINGQGQQSWVYDSVTPRLAICTWSSGAKVWYWVGRCNGRMIRKKIGSYPEMVPEVARKKAAKLSHDILDGKDPREEKRKAQSEMTLKELHGRYMTDYCRPKKSAKSAIEDEQQFTRYIPRALQNARISSITKNELTRLHNSIGEKAPVAANRLHALLSRVFNFAIDELEIPMLNPCQRIKKFHEDSRDRWLNGDELSRFFPALTEEQQVFEDYFKLLLFTGVRKSNLLQMRWDEIDFREKTWRIPNTKNKKPHLVVLADQVIEILERRRSHATTEWVFPGHVNGQHLKEPKSAWDRITTRAGIDNATMHDLRRTLATWMLNTGANEYSIQRALGHTVRSITGVYARSDQEVVRASIQAAVDAMAAANGGKDGE